MKTLEDKIINRIFRYEARKTILTLVVEFLAILFLILAVIITGQVIFEILNEQQSFDFFQLFGENFEVVKKFFFDTVYIFYLQLPKILVLFWLLFLSGLCFLILTSIKNFTRIKNKINSLLKIWRTKK